MKRLVKITLIWSLMMPCTLMAQNDSIRLFCPLNEAVVVPPPKNIIHYDVPDLCIVLQSIPDSVVKACSAGTITNVTKSEEENGGWEVVMFTRYKNKEYYFWYSGLEKISVRRNEGVKMGQPLGIIKPGGKIELLMYDFETQVDPTRFLDCKKILKNDE